MRLLALFAIASACSNGAKQDAPTAPPQPTPQAQPQQGPAPQVVIEAPGGALTIDVEVVHTTPKIERGLMFREHLAPDAGMLFFMGSEYDWAFYMRNTLIPLDMLFIAKDLTIAGIVENAEPKTETLRRVGKPSLYVLEVNGGWVAAHRVVAGTKVRFEHLPAAVKQP